VPTSAGVSVRKLNATQYEATVNVAWNTAAIVNDVSNVYYPELLFDFDGEGLAAIEQIYSPSRIIYG
jgi:hypothetical protein